MKTLIIDNYDSFTYILKQYVGELCGNPEVCFNDKITVNQIKQIKPTHIILSPGPGTVEEPKDTGIMFDVIKAFYKKIPILGVCLGHQAIAGFFAHPNIPFDTSMEGKMEGKIVRAPEIMHGKRSKIYHLNQEIFKGVRNPFEAMRYHSLIINASFWMNPNIDVTANTSDFLIMGIQHNKYPVFGVQFHPESLGTKEGKKIIRNFLKY